MSSDDWRFVGVLVLGALWFWLARSVLAYGLQRCGVTFLWGAAAEIRIYGRRCFSKLGKVYSVGLGHFSLAWFKPHDMKGCHRADIKLGRFEEEHDRGGGDEA